MRPYPANVCLDEDHTSCSSWWKPYVFKTSSRLFKTSSRRLQDVLPKQLQDVFKTSSRSLAETFSRHFQDVFKTSSRRLEKRLQDVLKTSSRHLQDVLQRYLQDLYKMYHQVKLFLLTRLWEAFNTFLRHSFPKTK